MNHYDAIILGSGQAGNPLARFLASQNLKIALIEKGNVGGTCVNVGCTPTKTLVASAKVAYLARRSHEFGVITGDISIDLNKILERTREIVLSSRNSNERSFESNHHIDLIRGEARFIAKKEILVKLNSGEEQTLSGDKIYINTGCTPSLPHLEGLDSVPYFTSDTIFDIKKLPEHIILIGASYIALEFAQIFRRFGSQVTVISHSSDFLPREDKDISDILLKVLKEEGIQFLFNASSQKVLQEEGKIILELLRDGNRIRLEATDLFVATGRKPNSNLNLEIPGIELDKSGFIKTNEFLETTAPDIYALGDVKGGPQFTHISYDDYRIVRDNILGQKKSYLGRLTNYTLFTDPELARIGLNEVEAKRLNIEYRVCYLPMNYVARALEMAETHGMMKALVDSKSEKILGATILGIQGGEIASTIQVAMTGGLKVADLHNFVFSHPTMMESLNNLFAQSDLPK